MLEQRLWWFALTPIPAGDSIRARNGGVSAALRGCAVSPFAEPALRILASARVADAFGDCDAGGDGGGGDCQSESADHGDEDSLAGGAVWRRWGGLRRDSSAARGVRRRLGMTRLRGTAGCQVVNRIWCERWHGRGCNAGDA